MKIRKELWFGFSLMGLIVAGALYMLVSVDQIERGHIGLLMLSLVVVAIMLGFPTAFTLMGMGMIFTWLAYERNTTHTLDLMVQAAYKTMANDVLIAIPLFVFMGYLVERANLIEKLFRSIHLMLARVPGALAVATLVTCAIFATATGIVGAVVTLMGLLAMPAMLRAGYSIQLTAGTITAGGCLGILIPPSVLLIVYGATAGVSVVQLYAGAFFPGIMLAGLYVLYVIVLAKLKPSLAPPLSAEERIVRLPPLTQKITPADGSGHALAGLLAALKGSRNRDVPTGYLLRQLFMALLPALLFALVAIGTYRLQSRRWLWRRHRRTDAHGRTRPPRNAILAGCRSLPAPKPAGCRSRPLPSRLAGAADQRACRNPRGRSARGRAGAGGRRRRQGAPGRRWRKGARCARRGTGAARQRQRGRGTRRDGAAGLLDRPRRRRCRARRCTTRC